VCLGPLAVRAEQITPRDVWPQATGAVDSGDAADAAKKTNELLDLGKSNGIRSYPLYASAAAAYARQAASLKNQAAANWANQAADQLDPGSPSVAFTKADAAADAKDWLTAIKKVARGYVDAFTQYRARLLSRGDVIVVALIAIFLTGAIFAMALFIRHGRTAAHDFREILGARITGGSVTVLAVALLFLPIFLWLGPAWLLIYWLIIFFGYANGAERFVAIVLALVVGAAPVVLDLVSNRVAGVESPVLVAAISGQERSYQPDALRRLQELINVVPDRPLLHLLLGNLEVMEGNAQQAANSFRRSVELRDNAGAHVNIGNLHFLDNDIPAAINEYQKAEALDSNLAIAFFNHSVASGESFHFDDQKQMLEQAKRIDPAVEKQATNQKIVWYRPPISVAWREAESIARLGAARTLFGNYAFFDPLASAKNPVTLGCIVALIAAPLLFLKRRRAGFAGACIKCGRTFCHRCKSARESATYCTQCIHIYLKRDGVSLATKREKLDQVVDYQSGTQRRNKIFGAFVPGSGQLLEGRTIAGTLGVFLFLFFVALAVLTGRLAPVLVPGSTAQIVVRVAAIVLAIIVWILMTPPVLRRKVTA
ncbi:MAG TPA: tetratricopeptide repeat protein, partial [Thermoanaerobaculia bacterium]|nr:tetratricopeptide repeat protein [Thermoanaerobaculia bacterium]